MEKLIIAACICGAEVTKEHNPAVPYTIEEIVREAKSAYDAGASVIHLHVREDDGTPTQVRNILIGEVWLCSGQSNMSMPMNGFSGQPIEGALDIIMDATPSVPIRMCMVGRKASVTPEEDCKAQSSSADGS